ncbi:hypothetical protein AAFF_G00434420 [Aldrovandia affinis]|uniref:Death domain-containing protein n=1 Tax=Aldrovandia affinis TaxID=143900 RepID=A0AAD7WI75_9TELE|nr:hypothetical protein AAFF_G00434420 [Aldrovandia affinis]
MEDPGPRQPESDGGDSLLGLLAERNRQLEAALLGQERAGAPQILRQLIALSRDLSTLHLDKVTTWRETLQASLEILSSGTFRELQTSEQEDEPLVPWKDLGSIGDAVHGVVEDLRGVEGCLQGVKSKLDTAAHLALDRERESTASEGLEVKRPSQSEEQEPLSPQNLQAALEGPRDTHGDYNSHDAPQCTALNRGDVGGADAGGGDEAIFVGGATDGFQSSATGTEEEEEEGGGGGDGGERPEGGERREGWVTRALPGRPGDGAAEIPNCCYVTAPAGVARVMTCEVVDSVSSRVVSGAEELVSSVLRIQTPDRIRTPCPLSVAVPFASRHRGSYRDIVVKVMDEDGQASYVSPASTEGVYDGQRGSFAEVKVYKLGLFAVVCSLRRESFTVPRKGLSLKLSMDSRICFDYLPGTFTAPVVVQSMIQPVDGSFLSMLKSRSDAYQGVLSTSALVYLAHPSNLRFRRPPTLTLPCPPNPDRKRAGEEADHARPSSAAPVATRPGHRMRASSASVKSSRDTGNEHLVLLGFKEDQWTVLEEVIIRNMQNGLVSFELTENLQRLIVVRLANSVRPSHLVTLVEDVEDSVHSARVTIVLHHQRDEPQRAVVALVPSKDLSWELARLRREGYSGPPDPSGEISMREGEQLQLSFRGNIMSAGRTSGASVTPIITFHSQRKNRLFLRLAEVDEFGNYSSPHYKGTAIFHRVTQGQLTSSGDTPIISLDDPLSDELLLWLCEELSEEDAALLVLCLRVRRSSIQLVKLTVPEHLPRQVFQLLTLWRRNLPTSTDKTSLLSRYLGKCGRPDLAKELLGQLPGLQ